MQVGGETGGAHERRTDSRAIEPTPVGSQRAEPNAKRVTASMTVRLGLALTLVVLVLMSVRFARYDWTGIPLEQIPDSVERVVSGDCTELIGTYETDTGRVVEPVTVDDEQYMSLVALFRDTPRDELQSECLYRPYVGRFAQPWVASMLPFDEATALAVTNVFAMVVSVWALLAALRAQRVSPRVFVVVGVLFAVGWNTPMAASVITTDSGMLAIITLGWWLVVTGRLHWGLALLALAVPVRETVLVLAPVILAAGFARSRRRAAGRTWPAGERRRFAVFATTCVVVPVFAVAFWGLLAPDADASWGSTPSVAAFLFNLGSVSFFTVVVAGAPLFLPALLQLGADIRRCGVVETLIRPARVGLIGVFALCLWILVAADLSPRFLWVGYPFAAAMIADWLSHGHLGRLLDRVRPERLVGA